ncbi:MAG: HEAT repeat domain-containing protein, partial [bacterium]
MEPDLRQALIARLSSKEEELRRAAMEGLKEGLAEEDLQWLVGPLSDESWRVRKEAIDGLSRIIPSSSLVNHLVPMMDPSRELTLRNSIVEVLERMGRDAAPFILEHIGTQQQDVRKFLVDILGNIADPATLPGLLELLHDPEDNIRAAAAEALASVGDPSVCDALLKAIAVSDEWVIFSILGSLARLRSVKALPVFFQFLGDHILAKPALTGIGLLGGLQEGMRLLAMLPDLSRGAAKTSFLALGAIYRRLARSESREDAEKLRVEVSRRADETIVQFLVAQLAVSDQHEKKQDILGGLGMIGGREALDAIIALVEDEDLGWDVDLALYSAAMGDLAVVTAMLDHGNPFVRRKVVQTLGRLGRDGSLPYLKGMLSDESGHVRKDAAKALAAMGDTSCVQ